MTTCTSCGNDYEKTFTVVTPEGEQGPFDSFECAIHAVAPRCKRCGVTILGHGVEVDAQTFCCSHCARQTADVPITDRVVIG
ncbi:hypothetical protein [Ruania alba]|uniref:Metallothionein n=1 Tax=Ruania alba TaxID=648782 RepID=A0A1H5LQF8_9MICO|nr:hypothetical protein [Ruania alba]SEE79315.1 hypothetical protein SAMN04488554_2928 [Ruania alba]